MAYVLLRTSGHEDLPPPDAHVRSRSSAEIDAAPTHANGTDDLRAGTAVRVWLDVRPRQRLFAIGERIRVTEYGRDLEVRAEVVAGDGGSWRLPGPRRSSSLVTVERGDQVWFRRVEPDGSGELHLDLGPDRPVRGRVVDKAALPVEGALVWCGDATDRTVTTDAEGRFEIAVKSSTGVPIVVRKEGKAHKHVFVDVAATASETVVDFVVTDAATLVVQVAGTREALRDAFAFVLPGESPTTCPL